MNASEEANSFCIFKFIGFKSCMGCGIGHSIHHALHFEFRESIEDHLMGIPATLGIFYLIFKPFLSYKKQSLYHGPKTDAYDVARLGA
jgi:hypothetical protein